eukprot:359134_1
MPQFILAPNYRDFDIKNYIGICIGYSCFFISWAVIGFFLYSEMTATSNSCDIVVLIWSIMQIIEQGLVFGWLYKHCNEDCNDNDSNGNDNSNHSLGDNNQLAPLLHVEDG